jgi:Fe-S-cluster containining protein
MQNDSVDKIITRYFAAVTRDVFTYKGNTYRPRALKVSPLLLRGYTCPAGCGGCCPRFSLDYLPQEVVDDKAPKGVEPRLIQFDKKAVLVYSDQQLDHKNHHCRYLMKDGRCANHPTRPFSCDFELIRTLHFESGPDVLTQKLFGRGWSFKRVDGERGALCSMTPITDETRDDVVRKLERLKAWTDHFGIATWLPDLLQIIKMGRLHEPVIFDPNKKKGMVF